MAAIAIRDFFSTEDRPVQNKELTTFRRLDPEGWKEICKLVDEHLAQEGTNDEN